MMCLGTNCPSKLFFIKFFAFKGAIDDKYHLKVNRWPLGT